MNEGINHLPGAAASALLPTPMAAPLLSPLSPAPPPPPPSHAVARPLFLPLFLSQSSENALLPVGLHLPQIPMWTSSPQHPGT